MAEAPAKKAPAKKAPAKKAESSALVKMVNEAGKTADVHPNEVENFKSGGYREA